MAGCPHSEVVSFYTMFRPRLRAARLRVLTSLPAFAGSRGCPRPLKYRLTLPRIDDRGRGLTLTEVACLCACEKPLWRSSTAVRLPLTRVGILCHVREALSRPVTQHRPSAAAVCVHRRTGDLPRSRQEGGGGGAPCGGATVDGGASFLKQRRSSTRFSRPTSRLAGLD